MSDRYQKILTDPLFLSELEKIRFYEKERIYCGHDIHHLLDVARVTYISVLEQRQTDPLAFGGQDLYELKDIIYAAALLHDIGRGREYEDQTLHHEASSALASRILTACGFPAEQIHQIRALILEHRGQRITPATNGPDLTQLFKEADKTCRLCFICPAADSCKWDESTKNQTVRR